MNQATPPTTTAPAASQRLHAPFQTSANVRTRIKICGLTREADVDAAVAAGADAIGFVMYPKSPRYVSPERAAELARRKLRKYPPFVRLALIRISHAVEDSGGAAALSDLAAAMRGRAAELGLQLLGPAPAPLALLRGRRRYSCLVKGQDWQAIRALYFFASTQKSTKNLRLFLDLDPVNML